LFRLGNVGRFVAMDLLEKIFSMGSVLSANISHMTEEETKKYKTFLEDELEKIKEQENKKKPRRIKIE
ncbi:MAG: PadR family transcriptional regulator, partial [Nitrosopumilaceae archaeon]